MLWITLAKGAYIAAAILILSVRFKPDLRVTMLDVGQGDGIVIEGGGLNILLDGGSSSRSGVGSSVIEPYLEYEGISRLDAVITIMLTACRRSWTMKRALLI